MAPLDGETFEFDSIDRDAFLALSDEAVSRLVRRVGRPTLGVFVPDGSRRMVLAFSDVEPGTQQFYRLCASLPAQYLLASLKVVFSHGLSILLVPILSRAVLERGQNYRRHTALEGLRLLFDDATWQGFYDEFDVCVRVYGDLDRLTGTECEPALAWIRATQERTSGYGSHRLYFAIGESPWLGQDIAEAGILFYQTTGRAPTWREQIHTYYGDDLPPADFFIMSSKLSGMGALPRFLINGDTEIYFLPAAGSLGLNARTFREILYDLVVLRSGLRRGDYVASMDSGLRTSLRTYYQQAEHAVIGLGQRIDGLWVA